MGGRSTGEQLLTPLPHHPGLAGVWDRQGAPQALGTPRATPSAKCPQMIAKCLATLSFTPSLGFPFLLPTPPSLPFPLSLLSGSPCPYCQADPSSSSIPITASLLGWPLHPRSSEKP